MDGANIDHIRYFRPSCPVCGQTLHGLHWKNCASHVAAHADGSQNSAYELIAEGLYRDLSDHLRKLNWPVLNPDCYEEHGDGIAAVEFVCRCPVSGCRHPFAGNGFDGIDAHWKSKHEDLCSYEEARALVLPIARQFRAFLSKRTALLRRAMGESPEAPAPNMSSGRTLQTLIQDLYDIVDELEALYPGRKFTPDGHLVGSIGEAIAAEHYALKLLSQSSEGHDAVDPHGRYVQIKATQGNSSVSIYSEPDRLLVLRLFRDGRWEEVYDGPGCTAWAAGGPVQKNGQRKIGLTRLRSLQAGNDDVDDSHPLTSQRGEPS